MQVFIKGRPVEFDSALTDEQALAACARLTSDTFAQELWAKRSHLSRLQIAWAHKKAIDAAAPKPAGLDVDLSAIVTMFDRAHAKLKHPAIALRCGARDVRLYRCGEGSRAPGSIGVCSCERGGPWYGRIERDGRLTPGRDLDDLVRALLSLLSTDPARVASEYGQLTGRCCFCSQTLTHESSTAVGYGPVCADHFGLPWGNR